MKLATLNTGHPDGRLLIVSRDLGRAVEARSAETLQDALDRWTDAEPKLRAEAERLEAGAIAGFPLEQDRLLAAMPRSFQFLDASAFLAHNHILADAWGYERRTPADPPLMYQGLSDRFLPAHGEVSFLSAADEIDFEAEFGVITDRVPRGIAAEAALDHVRLLLVINDWSLRRFGPVEMKGGFGFLHAKPPSSLSAIAVTPDELGARWHDGRVNLELTIRRNQEIFGQPDGAEMSYGFGELIAHAAATRDLCAGTVLGSGTVSNSGGTRGSGCIAERRALDQLAGRSLTPYLSDEERICLETQGVTPSLFGQINQVIRVNRLAKPGLA